MLSAQGGIMSVNREKDRSTGSNQCDSLHKVILTSKKDKSDDVDKSMRQVT